MFKTTLRAAAVAALSLFPVGAFAATLTTAFASNNSQDGNMFDIVIGANNLTLEAFELNLEGASSVPVEFYIKPGTMVGSQNTPGAWTLVSSANVVSNGFDNPTLFDVTDTVLMAGATYGVYLTAVNQDVMNYTNGTSVGDVAAANTDLSILEGYGTDYAFGFFFSPRIWNGSIIYSVATVPLPASILLLGGGLMLAGAAGRRRRTAQA
jgi:hypothetical protein